MSYKTWADVYSDRAQRYDDPLDVCEFYDGSGHCSDALLDALCDRIAQDLRLLPSDHVLDVGCGCGVLMRRMLGRAQRFVGVDPSAGVLAKARAAMPGVEFHQASAERLPLADQTFDKCFSFSVIHFFENLAAAERAVREIGRVLRPGGRILLAHVPNAAMEAEYQQHRRARGFQRSTAVQHELKWLWYPPDFFDRFRDIFREVNVKWGEADFDQTYRYRMDVEIEV
jgi:ubiquinone/menaquinone biosynthesis C-methylase UbiE